MIMLPFLLSNCSIRRGGGSRRKRHLSPLIPYGDLTGRSTVNIALYSVHPSGPKQNSLCSLSSQHQVLSRDCTGRKGLETLRGNSK